MAVVRDAVPGLVTILRVKIKRTFFRRRCRLYGREGQAWQQPFRLLLLQNGNVSPVKTTLSFIRSVRYLYVSVSRDKINNVFIHRLSMRCIIDS